MAERLESDENVESVISSYITTRLSTADDYEEISKARKVTYIIYIAVQTTLQNRYYNTPLVQCSLDP